MKLHILFGQRKCEYPGQYAPEALECWDEFCIDENPDGFEEACEKRLAECGKDSFSSTRVVIVTVDDNKLDEVLNSTPEIEGSVEG